MVKLRWLQVNKFRSVKPGTRLLFNDGYNVLLGQNGTGKTTLLNLVAATVKSDFRDFEEEEFDLEYELSMSETTAIIAVRNELPLFSDVEGSTPEALREVTRSATLSAKVELQEAQGGLRLRLAIEGKQGTAELMGGQTSSAPIKVDLSRFGGPLWALILWSLDQWAHGSSTNPGAVRGLREIFLERVSRRFDEALEYFQAMGSQTIRVIRFPDGTIQSIADQHLPTAMEVRLHELAQETWGKDRYTLADADLPFLKQAISLLDYESAEAVIGSEVAESHGGTDSMTLGGMRFYFRHRGNWKISERQLSYGQKRMLAFLYYMATVRSTVIADELVNGLHHRWIRACIEMMGQRQVFLTSQNPLLLDYLTFQSPEEVRSTFVLCSWEKGPEQMVWSNMSQEAAEDFFDSYKVRFQQVGELLQAKGLW